MILFICGARRYSWEVARNYRADAYGHGRVGSLAVKELTVEGGDEGQSEKPTYWSSRQKSQT
jgi:hypothetical protein